MAYRPDLRLIPSNISTRAGWFQGSFHVPSRVALEDFLNKDSASYNITEVRYRDRPIPFLSLQRRAIFMVVPAPDPLLAKPPATAQTLVPAQCVFVTELAVIQAQLDILRGMRVSDFVDRHKGFLLVHRATAFYPNTPPTVYEDLLINTDRIIGVSDQTQA